MVQRLSRGFRVKIIARLQIHFGNPAFPHLDDPVKLPLELETHVVNDISIHSDGTLSNQPSRLPLGAGKFKIHQQLANGYSLGRGEALPNVPRDFPFLVPDLKITLRGLGILFAMETLYDFVGLGLFDLHGVSRPLHHLIL